MNKELELEVEKYCEKVWGGYKDDVFKHDGIITDKTLSEISKIDFIAGATSKYVERQKLEFAIKELKSISLGFSDANTVTVYNLSQKIKELEQKLSKL